MALDKLPAELIVHIAVNTSPDTVLALSQVSKTLRQTCYDPLVFLKFFESRAWAREIFGNNKDAQLVARYAVAEYRYAHLMQTTRDASCTDELARYLLNLVLLENPVAHGHLSVQHGTRFILQDGVSAWRMEHYLTNDSNTLAESRPMVAMLFACGNLEAAIEIFARSNMHKESKHHRWLNSFTYDALEVVAGTDQKAAREHWHANCMIGLAKLSTLRNYAFPNLQRHPDLPPDYDDGGPRRPHHVDPPGYSQVPSAHSLRSLPIPFLPDAQIAETWTTYLRHQRHARSTCSYLDSGEWVGIYSYNELPYGFDEPMRGIRFTTRDAVTPMGGLSSDATGVDQHGSFVLTLSSDKDGYMHGRKDYQNGISWSWYLSNTPFGLYGLWTSEMEPGGEIGYLGGAVWLWKREWVEGGNDE